MSLRFILGRAGSGKSHYCLEDIKRKIENGFDKPLIYLVPEQFSFQAEKNLLHHLGTAGMNKAEVMSFKRMAYRVMNEVGGITRQHMNAAGANMLIYRILEENRGQLTAFLKASHKRGFVDNVSNVIKEMKKYEVSGEILEAASINIEDPLLKKKMNDISIIFDAFQKRLHENYIDSEDELTMLCEKMQESKLLNGAEIWMDEFFSFTPQEFNIVERLLKKAKRVNITLSMEGQPRQDASNTDVFLPTKNTESKLIEIARDNNIAIDSYIKLSCTPCFRYRQSEEMEYMEKNLYSFPYKAYSKKTENISIFRASGRYSEVEETARDILRLCREKNYRFKDIAVISGELDAYEKLVRAVFSEHNIPFFIDKKREVNGNPLVILLSSAVEIVSKNWAYEPMFRYLKSGLINVDRSEIDLIENYVLAAGIKGKRWVQEADWDYRINYGPLEEISESEKDMLVSVNNTRAKITAPLMKLDAKLKKANDAREMCKVIYEFLCDIQIPEKIQQWISEFKEAGQFDKVIEYGQIWETVMKVLEQVVEVMGSEKITVEQLVGILNIGFEKYEVGLIPPAIDQVLVGSIQRLRSHEVKILYIIGSNDGIFPSPTDGDVIFNDDDREKLMNAGVELAKDSKSRAFEEQFLVYTTMTTPGYYLRLSYSISDSEGKTLRPSIIISRLKKLFPEIREENNIINTDSEKESMKRITSPEATFSELISVFRKNADGNILSMLWLDVYRWFQKNEEWKKKLDRILGGFSYSNEAELFDTLKVRKLYGRHMHLSVSKLEKYAECPFSYFVQYGLKAKERKVYKLTKPDIGTFMHDVLYSFSKLLNEKGIKWREVTDEFLTANVNDIVEKKVSEVPSSILNSSQRYKHNVDNMKRVISRAVWVIVKHMKEGDFVPKEYEVAFGEKDGLPPIKVQLHDGENVYLIGRIDRVDVYSEDRGSFIRIIDYKSGNKEFSLSDVYNGFQLQLLVYLDAILEDMGKKADGDMLPGGMFYLRLDDPIIKSTGELSDVRIQEEIIKKLRMDGLLLADQEIIKHMDNDISGSSNIIPAKINKDNSLSKISSAATIEQFNNLRTHVKETIVGICEEILEGKIDLIPCRKGKYTPCEYCSFSPICQFDPHINGNRYKFVEDMNSEEVWNALDKKYSGSNEEGK